MCLMLLENNVPPKPVLDESLTILLVAMKPTFQIPNDIYNKIAAVHR